MLLNSSGGNSARCTFIRKLLGMIAPILVILGSLAGNASASAVTLTAFAAYSMQPKRRDPVQEKIDRIIENGSKSPVPPRSTVFSEDEVNQILRVQMREALPNGLSDPQVTLIGNNILAARVVVDFDEYKRRRQGRGSLGPLALLGGKLPVNGRGVLHSRDGQGQVKLDSADVNGIPLPPAVVREIIAALTRSAPNPQGYDIEQPFTLPASIRVVRINPKQAVVTQ